MMMAGLQLGSGSSKVLKLILLVLSRVLYSASVVLALPSLLEEMTW